MGRAVTDRPGGMAAPIATLLACLAIPIALFAIGAVIPDLYFDPLAAIIAFGGFAFGPIHATATATALRSALAWPLRRSVLAGVAIWLIDLAALAGAILVRNAIG